MKETVVRKASRLVGLVAALALAVPTAAHANTIQIYGSKCLDDPGASHAAGTRLWIYPCNGTQAQNWTPQFLSWAHYPDVPVYLWRNGASGLCVDVKGNSLANGTPAIQWYCNGNDGAQRIATSYNFFSGVTFGHYGTGQCLDNSYNRNATGNSVWWWGCNGTFAQEWAVLMP